MIRPGCPGRPAVDPDTDAGAAADAAADTG